MYYEINVAKLTPRGDYKHFFATSERSITTLDSLKEVATALNKAFPVPEFRITVTREEHIGYGMSLKEVLDVDMKVVEITPNEKQLIDTLIKLLYAESGYSDVDVSDLSEHMHRSMPEVKGILSSLVKKSLISTDRTDSGFDLVYLNECLWHTHPSWKTDVRDEVESVRLVVK